MRNARRWSCASAQSPWHSKHLINHYSCQHKAWCVHRQASSDADLDTLVAQSKLSVGGESQSVERCTVRAQGEVPEHSNLVCQGYTHLSGLWYYEDYSSFALAGGTVESQVKFLLNNGTNKSYVLPARSRTCVSWCTDFGSAIVSSHLWFSRPRMTRAEEPPRV